MKVKVNCKIILFFIDPEIDSFFFFIFNYFQNKTKHCYYETREDVMKYPASRCLSIFLDKSTYLGMSKVLCAQGSYEMKIKVK